MRWVHEYGNRIYQIWKKKNKNVPLAWKLDETYIKVKGKWCYLYRAIESEGNMIDFYLNKTRNHKAAKRFFKKALRSFHVSRLRVTIVDKNPPYPMAIAELKKEKKMSVGIQIRQIKYLNNIVEQDYRFIKKTYTLYVGI